MGEDDDGEGGGDGSRPGSKRQTRNAFRSTKGTRDVKSGKGSRRAGSGGDGEDEKAEDKESSPAEDNAPPPEQGEGASAASKAETDKEAWLASLGVKPEDDDLETKLERARALAKQRRKEADKELRERKKWEFEHGCHGSLGVPTPTKLDKMRREVNEQKILTLKTNNIGQIQEDDIPFVEALTKHGLSPESSLVRQMLRLKEELGITDDEDASQLESEGLALDREVI